MRKALTKHIVFLIGLFSLVAVQLSASNAVSRVFVKGTSVCAYSTEHAHLRVSATNTKVERQFLAEEVETEIEEEDYTSKKQASTHTNYIAEVFHFGLAYLTSTQTHYLQHQPQDFKTITPLFLANRVIRI